MSKTNNGHGLFRKWLMIDLCFLIFMSAITLAVYSYTHYHIKKQLDELHISNLHRMEAEMNAVFNTAVSTVNEYMMDPKLRTLLGADLSNSEREIAELIDDIKQTNSTIADIAEIMIYFKSDGVFIGSAGVMEKEIFFEVYPYAQGDNGLADRMNDQSTLGRFVPVFYGRTGVYTAMYTQQFMGNIFVSAILDNGQMDRIVDTNLQGEQNIFCVLTSNHEIILQSSNTVTKEALQQMDLQITDEPQTVMIGSMTYMGFVTSANQMHYVSLIDEGSYLARELRIQRTAITLLVFLIIVGAGISYYLTRYKYKPVQNVIRVSRAITPQYIYASGEDELKQIQKALEFLNGQKEQTQAVLNNHNMHIKNDAIKMLLDKDLDYENATEYIKSLIAIQTNRRYTVAVMELDPYAADTNATHWIKKCVPNIKHIVPKGGRLVLLFEGKAHEIVKRLQRREDTWFGTIAVGNDGIGVKGIINSYQDAMIGLSGKILPNAQAIIPPVNHRDVQAITISTDDEIRLSGSIQSADEENALAFFDELVQTHDRDNVDQFSYKAYLFNIASAIMRSAESVMKDEEIRTLLDGFNEAFAQEDYQCIAASLRTAIVKVSKNYNEKMKSANKHLNENVVRFIENNVSRQQLSSDMIADEMSMNSQYLRRFFKEQNGISLWDFINMKRIEQAKSLLQSTEENLQNIAAACGYVSISTFIRAFKKFSGMTPGRYRNLYR